VEEVLKGHKELWVLWVLQVQQEPKVLKVIKDLEVEVVVRDLKEHKGL
jgi:hypothetical protein